MNEEWLSAIPRAHKLKNAFDAQIAKRVEAVYVLFNIVHLNAEVTRPDILHHRKRCPRIEQADDMRCVLVARQLRGSGKGADIDGHEGVSLGRIEQRPEALQEGLLDLAGRLWRQF